jgi:hypothetical protein
LSFATARWLYHTDGLDVGISKISVDDQRKRIQLLRPLQLSNSFVESFQLQKSRRLGSI